MKFAHFVQANIMLNYVQEVVNTLPALLDKHVSMWGLVFDATVLANAAWTRRLN